MGTSDTNGVISGLTYFDLQTNVLMHLKFVADDAATTSDGAAIITITADDEDTDNPRIAESELALSFDIHRTPSIDVPSSLTVTGTLEAGNEITISGVTISDSDSEYVTVSVSASLNGLINSTSDADYNLNQLNSSTVEISGDITSVQDALDQLTFVAEKAGDLTLTYTIDDQDPLHARGADGTLTTTATQTAASEASSGSNSSAITIAISPPDISQVFTPTLKIGVFNSFSGLEISDLDSDVVTVTISSSSADFGLYDATSGAILEQANPMEISGSPTVVSEILENFYVKFDSSIEMTDKSGLITITVDDGDVTSAVSFSPEYEAIANAVPEPGGDILYGSGIAEDTLSNSISLSGINLFDEDADIGAGLISPESVKILSVTGGSLTKSDGASIQNELGEPEIIALSDGNLNVIFTPDANFFGTASIKYVVVDPILTDYSSSISEITINISSVNDIPVIKVSSAPVQYTQGDLPTVIFSNLNIEDIDSTNFAQLEISVSDLAELDYPDELFGMSAVADPVAKTLTYSGSNVSANAMINILDSVRFVSDSNNLVFYF